MKLISLINHTMTEKQIGDLENNEVIYFKDVEPELALQLTQTPLTSDKCSELAFEVTNALIKQKVGGVILPCGSPLFADMLVTLLEKKTKLKRIYAQSVREVTEITLPDGTVKKEAIFGHRGFYVANIY